MKTQHFFPKTVSAIIAALLLYSQHSFANVQNELAAEQHSDNIAIALCVILFIIGFSVLIALKIHDDKKNQARPRTDRYGQKHQYNH
ncbi:MAG TPA: hypothetical protein VKG26_03390 [Bacteroidia bacterium]|nr:hypothetical protein [Bacteroidia bacterium]